MVDEHGHVASPGDGRTGRENDLFSGFVSPFIICLFILFFCRPR